MAETFDPYYTWLGVPPAEQPPDHYRLLGVSRFENNLDVISNAADARMVYVRTFQSSQKSAISQKILNELSAAKICLLDAAKKTEYDRQLKAKWDKIEAAKRPAPVQPAAPAPAPLSVLSLLDEDMPLTAQLSPIQSMPSPQYNRAAANYPQSPAQQYPTRAPEFYNPNVRQAGYPGAPKPSQPAWLLPAIIGSGVVLLGLMVIVVFTVIGSWGSKPQVATNSPATNNSVPPPPSAVVKTVPGNNIPSPTNVPRPSTTPTKVASVPPNGAKPKPSPNASPAVNPFPPPTNVVPFQSPVVPENTVTATIERDDAQKPVSGSNSAAGRTTWKPKQGPPIVIQQTEGSWAQIFAGRPQFPMTEKQRTDEFIELFCSRRNRTYRLYADRAEFKFGGSPWMKEFDGGWTDEAVPVAVAGAPPNFPGAPPNFPGAPSFPGAPPNFPGAPPNFPGRPSSRLGGPKGPSSKMPTGPVAKFTPKSQGFCVQLSGPQSIEFANSSELASSAEPRTYEGWFRMVDNPPVGQMFGTYLGNANSNAGGFRFSFKQGGQTSIDVFQNPSNRSSTSVGGRAYSQAWFHFAASTDWQSSFQVFANGQQILQPKASSSTSSPSPEFWLGAVPNSPTNDSSTLAANMEVAAFRVSRGMLYSGNFTPPLELTADGNTLTLLDFSTGKGTVLTDRSNNGHTGNIKGGQWVPFR